MQERRRLPSSPAPDPGVTAFVLPVHTVHAAQRRAIFLSLVLTYLVCTVDNRRSSVQRARTPW